MSVNIFIQARMSSSRYPGKMLAPFKGTPLIQHIVQKCKNSSQAEKVVVLTSSDLSDDPLAFYLEHSGVNCYRGSLTNVNSRFQEALKIFPCSHFVRICGDSPYINTELIDQIIMIAKAKNCDIVSNVMERTFPKGQSVEVIKSKPFLEINSNTLSEKETEHVTPYIYNNLEKYNFLSITNITNESNINLCVDTVDDLKRLEKNGNPFIFNAETAC